MSYSYWLDEVGFVSRDNLKQIIEDPESGFTGFKRHPGNHPGAYGFITYNRKTVKLDILNPLH